MNIFELSSFPLEQVINPDGVMQNIADWFVPRDFPTRFFAYSHAFSMKPPIDRIRASATTFDRMSTILRPWILQGRQAATRADVVALRAGLQNITDNDARVLIESVVRARPYFMPLFDQHSSTRDANELLLWRACTEEIERKLWRIPWMKEMARYYTGLEEKKVRAADYFLATWEPPEVSAKSIETTLRNAFQRPVQTVPFLPSILQGPYEEYSMYLKPLTPGQPYVSVVYSYDMRDSWTISTLHGLLNRAYDVAIAVDIITYGRTKAQRKAEMAYNAANVSASQSSLLDTRAERVTVDARSVLNELGRQTLHELQLAVAVTGATRDELEANVEEVSDFLSPRLRLMRTSGCQGEAMKLFSTALRKRIDVPWKPRTQLSYAIGCMLGAVTFHRPSSTSGIFIGIDAIRNAPIFMDLFRDNQAAHIVILGKTGYGKTVFLNLLAERAAAVEGMQVIGIDAFSNGFRVAAAMPGFTCYRVGMDLTINILDVVWADDDWLANQVGHVIGQLSLLMGTPTKNNDGKEIFTPRVFTTEDRGVLDHCLVKMYQNLGITPDTATTAMPILSDLIRELDTLNDPVAGQLSRALYYMIFGHQDITDLYDRSKMNIQGRAFNGITTVDWKFTDDGVYYDFGSVGDLYRPFYYLQCIGAILRYLRLKTRDRSRNIFLQIDEFGYASQVDAVAKLAVEVTKTARKYRCGIVLIDQNPLTFFETESGRQIVENAAARIYFHLEGAAAQQVGKEDKKLSPAQVEWLSNAQTGQCLAVIRDDAYQINVDTNEQENRAFLGS